MRMHRDYREASERNCGNCAYRNVSGSGQLECWAFVRAGMRVIVDAGYVCSDWKSDRGQTDE